MDELNYNKLGWDDAEAVHVREGARRLRHQRRRLRLGQPAPRWAHLGERVLQAAAGAPGLGPNPSLDEHS